MSRGQLVGLTMLLVCLSPMAVAQSIGGQPLPVRGGESAVVEIVEVSDFQCPFCAKAQSTLKALARAYPDTVRFVFVHQPLPFHERALPAALASVVMQKHGKFWEFADTLFAEQQQISALNTRRIAEQLGVATDDLLARMKSPENQAFVAANQRFAEALGPRGTPTFFVNGTSLRGAQPLEKFKAIIDLESAMAGKGKLSVEDARAYRQKRLQSNNPEMYAYLYEGKSPTAKVTDDSGRRAPPTDGPVFKVTIQPDDPVRGAADKALVTLVGFIGYQCSYSRKLMPTYDALQEHYGDEVRLVLKQLPLPMHQEGEVAALAALCAHAQGKFWPMNARLFADSRLSLPVIRRKAKAAGADLEALDACMDADTARERLRADRGQAQLVGAGGTPITYVNGRKLSGALPRARFEAAIDAELVRVRALVAEGLAVSEVYGAILDKATLLEPLETTVTKLDLARSPTLGSAKAPVQLVVFGDYQCPYCAKIEPAIQQLHKRYTGRVAVTIKHYPLSFHPEARAAAEAAHCADQQGKFWPMHAAILEGHQHLTALFLTEAAQGLELDMEAFEACRNHPRTAQTVKADIAEGDRAGIRGTPTLFFNGRRYDLTFGGTPEDLAQTVDRLLKGLPTRRTDKPSRR